MFLNVYFRGPKLWHYLLKRVEFNRYNGQYLPFVVWGTLVTIRYYIKKKKSIYFYDIYFFILQDIKDTHPKVTIFYNMLLLVPNSGCQATVRVFFLPFFKLNFYNFFLIKVKRKRFILHLINSSDFSNSSFINFFM